MNHSSVLWWLVLTFSSELQPTGFKWVEVLLREGASSSFCMWQCRTVISVSVASDGTEWRVKGTGGLTSSQKLWKSTAFILTFSSRPLELAPLPQPPKGELEQQKDGSVRFRIEHLGAEVCAEYELYGYTKWCYWRPRSGLDVPSFLASYLKNWKWSATQICKRSKIILTLG